MTPLNQAAQYPIVSETETSMRALATVIIGLTLAPAAQAQESAEVRLVKQVMAQALPLSFKANREYCGYIGYDRNGTLKSSRVTRGKRDECEPRWPNNLDVVASWHTHAAYDVEAYSEDPSVTDIEADEDEGVDGYVGTPGGRLWYVDTQDMVVSQLCGLKCLVSDSRFRKGAEGKIAQSYTYRQLLQREAQQ
jgi:hypothetical protein